jgi:hypothetical protein
MHLGAALLRHPLPIGPLLRRSKAQGPFGTAFLDNDLHFLDNHSLSDHACHNNAHYSLQRLKVNSDFGISQ